MAQHKRPKALPAILVLEDTRVRPAGGLVPVLRGMGIVVPARAAGLRQYPGMEQCMRDSCCFLGRDYRGIACAAR